MKFSASREAFAHSCGHADHIVCYRPGLFILKKPGNLKTDFARISRFCDAPPNIFIVKGLAFLPSATASRADSAAVNAIKIAVYRKSFGITLP